MLTTAAQLLVAGSATSPAAIWPGGRGDFSVVASFGGASVNLQFLGPDSTTWIDVGATTSLTAAGHGAFDLAPGQIRANVVGGTPSGIYATAARIPQ